MVGVVVSAGREEGGSKIGSSARGRRCWWCLRYEARWVVVVVKKQDGRLKDLELGWSWWSWR